jgi:hypothetical protein
MSGGFRVSDSTIETAARALWDLDFDDYKTASGKPWEAVDQAVYHSAVSLILAAALPSLVAEIREQIASEIETSPRSTARALAAM